MNHKLKFSHLADATLMSIGTSRDPFTHDHLRVAMRFVTAYLLINCGAVLRSQTCPGPQPEYYSNDAWPQNSRVQVVISTGFTGTQVAAIKSAFINWQGKANLSGVSYDFLPTNDRTFVVQYSPDPVDVHAHDDEFDSTGKLLKVTAFIHPLPCSDPKQSLCQQEESMDLTAIIAHEIGHFVGLDDCYTCGTNSVMDGVSSTCRPTFGYCSLDTGAEGPTDWDVCGVNSFYSRSRPQKPTACLSTLSAFNMVCGGRCISYGGGAASSSVGQIATTFAARTILPAEPFLMPQIDSICRPQSSNQEIITSGDPNDKVGNPGAGPGRYLSSTPPMNYSIYFDNVPTATAPAQKVVITDQLNPAVVDLASLTLSPISFVDKLVTPPAVPLSALGTYTTDVDLRPAKNLITRMTAALNQTTGVLTWTYTSLDPSTMQPTTDPLAGFLPPGTEGSVSFSVIPKSTVTTGTVIQNTATVVFDVNPPINTPTWSNTIDNTKPTSRVALLPATVTASFPVQWSGSDVGAGVQDFTVYVSDNGGPFAAWLTNTTGTQGTYSGISGHTYAFYSIARDLVGNMEIGKTLGEASTRVVADTTPPIIVPQIIGTLGNNGWYRSSVTVNWTVTDPESGIASSTGCSSTTLTTNTAGVTLTCSAVNGAGLSSSVPVTIKIDQTPPVISGLPAAGCSLWPPNHKLVQVATVTAADALSGLVPGSLKVIGTSSEPSSDPKDPEIVVTPNGSGGYVVQLQSDRSGNGNGRVYTLTTTANDLAGNTATVNATCTVPHDQGK